MLLIEMYILVPSPLPPILNSALTLKTGLPTCKYTSNLVTKPATGHSLCCHLRAQSDLRTHKNGLWYDIP